VSVKSVILKFVVVYAVLLLVAVSLRVVFELDSIDGAYMGALVISVVWACWGFGSRNGRYFSNRERTTFVAVTVTIVMILKTTLVMSFASRTGLGFEGMGSALIFIGIIHAAVIYGAVWATGKLLAGRGLTGTRVS